MTARPAFCHPASLAAALLLALLLVGSCSSSIPLRPLRPGEARLSSIQMPDVVREGLTYDVILTLDTNADHTPPVRSVCFRWVAETVSSAAPYLYTYSMQDDYSLGSPWTKRVAQGMTTASDTFCAQPADIRSDVPGRIIVRIRAEKINPDYNKLESQAEYVLDGAVRWTNWIGTRIFVER
jgi:hypothetical protein